MSDTRERIKWDATPHDKLMINYVVSRAVELYTAMGYKVTKSQRTNIHMDVTACHLNGTPLDLLKLMKVDDVNFAHDILGIAKYINRKTGKLENEFLPRCNRSGS